MADSLFDNRYRYDHIYPRGRSGETLRAYDTQQDDLPVVVKRPAPNDAPPIRAGQEVSILNERRALSQLKGHPVLTELRATGQFFVGGTPHQYIVIERAVGSIIADDVSALSRQQERLPRLETLVIVDLLLDLLETAHKKEIIYNDVDAKHLFWDRDNYRLKVIDWGNAVFLEGDDLTPQGISRQTDIEQVGQLLYFIFTGGNRADIPRDADAEFLLDFGQDAERMMPRLQEVISKAAHPNTRFRYQSIAELRRDLDTFRKPLERERDAIVHQVAERLRRNLSKNDLRELAGALMATVRADPGHPDARAAQTEIDNRLRDLDVAADLDAVRIYMDGGNWARSADLLNELRNKTGENTAGLVNLLLDCSMHLLDNTITPTPPAVADALKKLFAEQYQEAAQTLLTQKAANQPALQLQWLLAERISARIPGILLLRPNLYRLDMALRNLAHEGLNIHDGQHLLGEITQMIDATMQKTAADLGTVPADYAAIISQLQTLYSRLNVVVVQHSITPRKLPLSAVERALNAATALMQNVNTISQKAATSPRDATVALDRCRAIQPNNPLWDTITEFLNHLYQKLQTYQTYVPAADGSDLAAWFTVTQKDLTPFTDCLADATLQKMHSSLLAAAQAWGDYADAVVMGNRATAIDTLTQTAQNAHLISPSLAGWLRQVRTVINGASTVERHAISGGYGRALADGWESFDRGRLTEAERLAQQAVEISRNETERFAAKRLLTLSTTARQWIERNGILDAPRTETTLKTLETLYQPQESTARDAFAAQMPGKDTYLKAMGKGLIHVYAQQSSPAVRIFFFNAILLGALETHDNRLDDARFWREVAVRALGDYGQRHIATRTLEDFIERRRDVQAAESLFNEIVTTEALVTLEKTRKKIEANPRAKLLSAGIRSLHQLENALRDWTDGEFRAAGLKLEDGIKAITDVEKMAVINLDPYRKWLMNVQATAAELHNTHRQMRQIIERRPAEPSALVRESHHKMAAITEQLLGESCAQQLQRWHQTYEAFLAIYTDKSIRRSAKIEKLDDLFKEMFIDRHPAYPLYRHWTDLTDKAPEFPAPPTKEPTPRLADDEQLDPEQYLGSRYADDDQMSQQAPITGVRLPSLRTIVLVLAAALIIVVAGVAMRVLNQPGGQDDGLIDGVAVTLVDESATPVSMEGATSIAETAAAMPMATIDSAVSNAAASATAAAMGKIATPTLVTPTVAFSPTGTLVPSETPLPADTNTPLSPSDTPTKTATHTPVPTDTPTPTITPSPTTTPTPTLPAAGLQGWQELLPLTERMEELPWNDQYFALAPEGNWHLGLGQRLPGDDNDQIRITFAPETLNLYFGNNAPSRIRRTEAMVSLITYDPTLDSENIVFGLLFQSVDDPATQAGVILEVVNLNAVNFWLLQGEERTFITQRSVNSISGRIRLERDAATGMVAVFFNDLQIGDPLEFTEAETPIQPVLFVRNGGVEVTIVNWRVGLR